MNLDDIFKPQRWPNFDDKSRLDNGVRVDVAILSNYGTVDHEERGTVLGSDPSWGVAVRFDDGREAYMISRWLVHRVPLLEVLAES